jgi:3-oxoacyl-[acyl-carrier protein] reductase
VVPSDVLADEVRGVAAEIEQAGGRATAAVLNVTDPAAVDATVAMALDRHGRIDVLVNNAGIARDNLLARMKREDWQIVLDVNLSGAFNCMQASCGP